METPQNERIVHSGRRPAPAKINATLEVLGKRPDGFHALRSVVIPLALYDEISWMPSAEFAFTCSDPMLAGDDNLVVRAARAMNLDARGIAVHLQKRIPYGSGLGGGSSNAAALLLAAMHGAFGPQPERDWLALARAIGSDVPLFLVDAPALIEATGERVTALGANAPWWAVLLCPALTISTRDAYTQLDAGTTRTMRESRADSISIAMTEAFQRREFDTVNSLICNDFEAVMFEKEHFAPALNTFTRLQQVPHLTGSGSALFALFEAELPAREFAQALVSDAAVVAGDMRVFVVPFAESDAWRIET